MYFSLFFKLFLNVLEHSRKIKKIKKNIKNSPKSFENHRKFKNSTDFMKFRNF